MQIQAQQDTSLASRRDERRKFERYFDPDSQLQLVVDHRELTTINWSPGGCLVNALKHWKIGDSVAGTLESREGVPMGAVISEVVRIDDDGRAALRFITVAPLF